IRLSRRKTILHYQAGVTDDAEMDAGQKNFMRSTRLRCLFTLPRTIVCARCGKNSRQSGKISRPRYTHLPVVRLRRVELYDDAIRQAAIARAARPDRGAGVHSRASSSDFG